VHSGSRLTCSLQLSGDFFSVQGKSIMQYENGTFSLLNPSPNSILGKNSKKPALLLNDCVDAGVRATHQEAEGEGLRGIIETKIPNLKANFSDRILMIKPYPGLDYAHFNLENVDAVLHDLYHSGTSCASAQWGENYSLIAFTKRCMNKNIKVYLAPAIKSTDAYQSTRELIEQGAEMIWNISIEAAYVKLMLAYGNFNGEQQIMEFIDRDIAGEHV
jgi:L-asparaginase